jgi:DNA-binding helix-hairpin-helix protein with protein kinase domain
LTTPKLILAELEAAAAKAFGTGAQADIDDYEAKLADYAGALAGISGTMDGISSKEILFKFKTQGSAAALEYASYLARGAEYGGISVNEDALDPCRYFYVALVALSGGPVMPVWWHLHCW